MSKIFMAGYWGFQNFGDDAILNTMIEDLKSDDTEIKVISNNPEQTKALYGVDSVKTFDILGIINEMKACDIYISGGGSIFQDKTSIKSLFYYLFLMVLAFCFDKKTCIYAQGVGPINTWLGRFLTKLVFENIDLITVRDIKSFELLKKWGITSYYTADNVWKINPIKQHSEPKTRVGVQLRGWKSLTVKELQVFADCIVKKFDGREIDLISFQNTQDMEVLERLGLLLENKGMNVNIIEYEDEKQLIETISNLDVLVAMRFHACLVAIKLGVPCLAISYDIKVDELAKEADMLCVKIEDVDRVSLNSGIDNLMENKDKYKENFTKYAEKKANDATNNIELFYKNIQNK